MELNLGRDQVLVSQQLQLPYPTSFHQLDGDVLRVGAQPAEYLIHRSWSYFKGKRDGFRNINFIELIAQ